MNTKLLNTRFASLLGLDVGIDIGTVSTLISCRDSGVILSESSAVALDKDKKVAAIGDDATAMLGRLPGDVQMLNPLQEGVVVDMQLCETMLRHFIIKALGKSAVRFGLRAVLCVPGCITHVEQRALEEAARGAGARAAFILDESVAAAIGAGLPVDEPVGTMVVDIGGGTTDAAVIAMGGVVVKHSVRAGGTQINNAIVLYIRHTYGVVIGSRTAEQIKLTIGSAEPSLLTSMEVRGRDLKSGLPVTCNISAMEIHRAIQPEVQSIINCALEVLSQTPPELSGDIYENGIWLTGGGSLLCGMANLFMSVTGVPAYIAANPLHCVVEGARIAAENMARYKTKAV